MGAATAAGAKLGRYQVVKHLASGGMAEVLLARATGIEGFTRHVVIKRIRPGQAKDQTFVQMFLNEARLAAQLHHQNIVQVHDIGQEGTEYFFAMEYVHGEDLRHLLTQVARHKQKVPLEHVVTIIATTALALHYAHEHKGTDRKPLGLVHRDVTPANILVGYDGHVKVVDFGIAKAAAGTQEATQAGTLKGKASYMAPEQCTGKSPVDRRSDVFALGIVLYELVTARRLFKGENDFLTMSAIVGGKVPPAKSLRPDLPDELDAIIMKALALDPAQRFQTADEMHDALEKFATSARLRTSTSHLASYMKQLFGERPEPWLVEDIDIDIQLTVDFDGSASGMVRPPPEALEHNAIPVSVEAMKSSPIMKARTKATTAAPPLATVSTQAPGKPARTLTAQIPVTLLPSDRSKPVQRVVAPAPPAAAPAARRQTKTVQIPAATQTASIPVQPKPVEAKGLPGVTAFDEDAEDAATVVAFGAAAKDMVGGSRDFEARTVTDGGVPEDIDGAWDPSRPFRISAAADLLASEQAAKAASTTIGASGANGTNGSGALHTTASSAGAGGGGGGGGAGGGAGSAGGGSAGGAGGGGAGGSGSGSGPKATAPGSVTAAASGAAKLASGAAAKTGAGSASQPSTGASSSASTTTSGAASSTTAATSGAAVAASRTTPVGGIAKSTAPTATTAAAGGAASAASAAGVAKAGVASPATAAKTSTPSGIAAKTSTPGGGVASTQSGGAAKTSTPGGGVASTQSGGVAKTSTPGGGVASTQSGGAAKTSTPSAGLSSTPSGSVAKTTPAKAASTPSAGVTSPSSMGNPAARSTLGGIAKPATPPAGVSSVAETPASAAGNTGKPSGTRTPVRGSGILNASGALPGMTRAAEPGSAAAKSAAAAAASTAKTAGSAASAPSIAGAPTATDVAGTPGARSGAAEFAAAARKTNLPGVSAAGAAVSTDTRDAIANMLRAPIETDDEATAVGTASDLELRDPHDAVTAVANTEDSVVSAISMVTFAEPITAAEPPPPSAPPGSEDDSIAAQFGASPTFSSAPSIAAATATAEPSSDDVPAASPLAVLLASPKRMAAVFGGVLALVVVLVFALSGDDKKPAAAGAPAEAEADKADIADKAVADPEPAPEPVELGSAAEDPIVTGDQAGSAEEPDPAAVAETDSPEAGSAADESAVDAPAVEKPVQKAVTKSVAAKAAAKPTKARAKKPAVKTATKRPKAGVQKPRAKKPKWDPNSLFPQKKK